MDIPTHDELLGTIDDFLDRHPLIGESRFGRDATGEPGLVERLRKGSSPTLKILNRIKAYMADKDAAVGDTPVHSDGDTTCAGSGSSGNAGEVSAPAAAA